jgi:hypothetical protein
MLTMESFAYIKNELDLFITLFPRTKISYEFDEITNAHFIEVLPNSIYHLDEQYIKWENDFHTRFITLFPNENIGFITDDSLIVLSKVDFQLIGKEYKESISISTEDISIIKYSEVKINILENGLVLSNINDFWFDSIDQSSFNKFQVIQSPISTGVQPIQVFNNQTVQLTADNTSYALAA